MCLIAKASSFDHKKSTISIMGNGPVHIDNKLLDQAISRLLTIGALERSFEGEDESLPSDCITPLGRVLANLPLHPTMGKMVITAALLGCLDPILTIVSAAGEKVFRPIKLPNERASYENYIANLPPAVRCSDHLIIHRLLQAAFEKRVHPPFLSYRAVSQVLSARNQLERGLADICGGKIPDHMNENCQNLELVRMVLASGLLPSFVAAIDDIGWYRLRTTDKNVNIGYTSSCHHRWTDNDTKCDTFVYSDLVGGGRQQYISNVTAIDPILLALFDCRVDWLGLHGVMALGDVENLRTHWGVIMKMFIQSTFLSQPMSSTEEAAIKLFRESIVLFSKSTTINRLSREHGGALKFD